MLENIIEEFIVAEKCIMFAKTQRKHNLQTTNRRNTLNFNEIKGKTCFHYKYDKNVIQIKEIFFWSKSIMSHQNWKPNMCLKQIGSNSIQLTEQTYFKSINLHYKVKENIVCENKFDQIPYNSNEQNIFVANQSMFIRNQRNTYSGEAHLIKFNTTHRKTHFFNQNNQLSSKSHRQIYFWSKCVQIHYKSKKN